jgi:hypothetical protein
MAVEKLYIFRIAARPEIKTLNAVKSADSSGVWKVWMHNVDYTVRKDDIGDYIEMGGDKWYLNTSEMQRRAQDEPLFVFHVNPKAIKVEMTKIVKKIYTRGGIEYQHWGDDSNAISFQGMTGSILPSGTDVALGREVYDTPAYRKFLELRDVYTYDQDELGSQYGARLLGLCYRRKLYAGHFERFSFEESEERPFQLSFDAQFVAHFEATDPESAVVRVSSSISAKQRAIGTLRAVLGQDVVSI